MQSRRKCLAGFARASQSSRGVVAREGWHVRQASACLNWQVFHLALPHLVGAYPVAQPRVNPAVQRVPALQQSPAALPKHPRVALAAGAGGAGAGAAGAARHADLVDWVAGLMARRVAVADGGAAQNWGEQQMPVGWSVDWLVDGREEMWQLRKVEARGGGRGCEADGRLRLCSRRCNQRTHAHSWRNRLCLPLQAQHALPHRRMPAAPLAMSPRHAWSLGAAAPPELQACAPELEVKVGATEAQRHGVAPVVCARPGLHRGRGAWGQSCCCLTHDVPQRAGRQPCGCACLSVPA